MPYPTTPTTPTTLLDAVNVLLKAVGSSEVSSLNNADMDQRAQGALSEIGQQCRTIQMEGWHFNTEDDYQLNPGTDKQIVLPDNLLALKVSERSSSLDVTQRGLRLYDRAKHTYEFDEPVFVNVILLLPFEDMPEPVRWYAVALAGRIFGVNRKPDSGTYRFTKEVEQDARAAALAFDTDARDRNQPELSPHFRNMRRR